MRHALTRLVLKTITQIVLRFVRYLFVRKTKCQTKSRDWSTPENV